MSFQTLITASELDHLCRTETDVVILDARFHLDDEDWGDRAFAESHIPGAQRASLATDLSGPIIEGVTGRRPFPASADFELTVRSWGIGPSTQVVVYDADRGLMAASRVWLMMRWIGHDAVAVLDGGLPAWEGSGYPMTAEATSPPAPEQTFVASVRPHMLAEVDEVDRVRVDTPTRVFDSRGPEGYHGQGKYYDPVRGHIKGAGSPIEPRHSTTTALSRARICGSTTTPSATVRTQTKSSSAVPGSRPLKTSSPWSTPDCREPACTSGSWSEWIVDPDREVEL